MESSTLISNQLPSSPMAFFIIFSFNKLMGCCNLYPFPLTEKILIPTSSALAIAFQIETRETLKCLAIISPEWNFPSARNAIISNKRFAKRTTLLK